MTDYSIEERREWALDQVALHAVPEPNTGCYLWLRGISSDADRYAVATFRGKNVRISRAILGLTDSRVFACHTCDTPLCVNQAHLYAGSHQDNVDDRNRRGRARSRTSWGEKKECSHGHALAPDNIYLSKDGRRRCVECRRIRNRIGEARRQLLRVAA